MFILHSPLAAASRAHGTSLRSTRSSRETDEREALMKVVLGYSGGLDTSIIVPWLRENYGAEVICMAAGATVTR